MTTDKTGGPAFPVNTNCDYDRIGALPKAEGMTLRDYFIAHAPAEPWPEFEPSGIAPLSIPSFDPVDNDGNVLLPNAEDNHLLNLLNGWRRNDVVYHDTPKEWDRYLDWMDEWERYRTEKDARDKMIALQRRIQWPAYWADTMIAERAK